MTSETVLGQAVERHLRRFWTVLRRTTGAALARPSYVGVCAGIGVHSTARATLGRGGPVATALEAETLGCEAAVCRGVRVSLPRRFFIAKVVALPGTNRDELTGMLKYELANLFPLPPEEVLWDWRPLCVREDGYTLCRVVAAEASFAASRIDALRLAQTPRVAIEPSTVSLANYYLAGKGSWPGQAVILAAVTGDGLDLAIVGPHGIEVDRGIASSGGHMSASEAALEIDVLLSLYTGAGASGQVCGICLARGGHDEGFARELGALTGLPVEALETPRAASLLGEAAATDLHIAAGAALGPMLADGLHLSLRTGDAAERERKDSRLYVVSVSVLAAVMTFCAAWLALAVRAYRSERFLGEIEARAARIRPIAGDVDAKRQRLGAIERQLAGQSRVFDVLVALYKLTPSDITLTSAEIDSQGVLTIKGQAQQLFRASEYAMLLDRNPAFGRPSQQGPRAYLRNDSGKTFIAFTIVRDLKAAREK